MKRLSALFGIAMLSLLAAAASQVRADYLNWTYTSSPNVPGISVNSTAPAGGATVTLTDFSTPQAGATTIPVVAYLTSTSNTTPVNFSNATFNLAMTLTDSTTNDSGTLNFTGSLSGSLTATTSSLIASFAPVTSNSLTLDGHTYTVTIPSVTLAPPTSPQQDIMASVSVSNASSGGGGTNPGSPGQMTGTPEPASLMLGSLGFSCLGVRYWWKRRRLTRTAAAA
ncbi:MAG TPA: hypothetical protein VMF69_12145 [Gemmataceae bacterium]|nr:hypothetical protein [Gemmataceae bacterium]